jgi:N,N'-diacetyllegionaminate synthase
VNLKIIAEIAQGYEGNPEQARLLLKAAAAAGAHAAKFQVIYGDELGTPDYKYYALFKSLEMPDQVWADLGLLATECGIELHLDIFGQTSLRLAEAVGAQAIKIHGTDLANLGLLEHVATSGVKNVLLGAGGAMLSEIETALNFLSGKQVVVLLGFQGYPTPNAANQVARVAALRKHFADRHGVALGFADHAPPDQTVSIAMAAMAYGAGAQVLEKHLTLGAVMKLEDHEAALNPDQFAAFAAVLKDCAEAWGQLGRGDDFGMSESEHGYRNMVRKHVVLTTDLSAGTVLLPEHLVLKRTASEDFLTDLALAYGKVLKGAVKAEQALAPGNI